MNLKNMYKFVFYYSLMIAEKYKCSNQILLQFVPLDVSSKNNSTHNENKDNLTQHLE